MKKLIISILVMLSLFAFTSCAKKSDEHTITMLGFDIQTFCIDQERDLLKITTELSDPDATPDSFTKFANPLVQKLRVKADKIKAAKTGENVKPFLKIFNTEMNSNLEIFENLIKDVSAANNDSIKINAAISKFRSGAQKLNVAKDKFDIPDDQVEFLVHSAYKCGYQIERK